MKSKIKVAIQGGPASFHDVVSQQYFSGQDIEPLPCMTFQRLFMAVKNRDADFGVLAIENTLAGSILGNYSLLHDYPVSIIGEAYLPIQQNLLALPGQTLADVRIVRSHPMALLQCSNFLEEHPHMQAIEAADTAESAREIRENNLGGVAAVASRAAAALYGLDILEECIENYKGNYTRFLVIKRQPVEVMAEANKASVNFRLHHRAGELARILDVFRDLQINLSLIQSIPIMGKPTEFTMLLDLEWNAYADFQSAMDLIIPITVETKILGIYKRGVK
jgi:prephenate dehydratase